MVGAVRARNAELQNWELRDDEKNLFEEAKVKEWRKVSQAKKAVRAERLARSRVIREAHPDRIIPSKFALRWK